MKRWGFFTAAVAVAAMASVGASAQTIKIGVINTMSGPAAEPGTLIDRGMEMYKKAHDKDLPAGVKIELIKRDDTGPNPEVAKRLATELITRDKVNFLAGFVYTPNAMAVGPLATEAKVPVVVMNAGTAAITTTSPYIARVSFTMWQSSYPLGQWAAKNNIKRVYSAVTDYGPGIDAESAFVKGFTDNGGTMVGSVHMPFNTADFVPYMQKAKDEKPDAVFVFVPAGVQAVSLMKAFGDVGLKQAGVKLIGPGDITTDEMLHTMGDVALGTVTMFHYSAAGKRAANEAFVKAYKAAYNNEEPAFEVVGGYDGMAAIYHAIIAQKGKMDPDKTMALLKGWKSDVSPRGPIMIDPDTRDIVQNEYLRRVEKVNGQLQNVEVETFQQQVKDPWKIINNKK